MYKPTLHSHTHCQAALANAKTQAWQQRVSVQPHAQNARHTYVRKRTPNL